MVSRCRPRRLILATAIRTVTHFSNADCPLPATSKMMWQRQRMLVVTHLWPEDYERLLLASPRTSAIDMSGVPERCLRVRLAD